MNESLEKASDMEAGQAGYPSTPTSLSFDEKSGRNPSTISTGLSTKPLNPKSTCQPTQPALKSLWTTFRSTSSQLGHWARRSRQQNQSEEQDEEDEENGPHQIVRTLDECPRGYPNVAAFLDSDECFSVYRRFGFLQSRILLDKQDKLRKLEDRLDKLDKKEEKSDVAWPMTTDLPKEQREERQKLLTRIEEEFTSYANLLDTAAKMMALNRPSEADYTSVRNYMGNREPFVEPEDAWVRKKEDLITLRAGREHAWLDSGIEKCLKFFHCRALETVFGDEQTKKKSSGEEVYYSHQRISNLASTIVTFMVLVLLVVPIYLLYHMIISAEVADGRTYGICVGILLVSTLAFSAVLCLFTRAQRHEILASAAAYCAVLVVFFGNVGPARRPGS